MNSKDIKVTLPSGISYELDKSTLVDLFGFWQEHFNRKENGRSLLLGVIAYRIRHISSQNGKGTELSVAFHYFSFLFDFLDSFKDPNGV